MAPPKGAYTRYYGFQHTGGGGNNEVLLDTLNWQKPCTLLGIRLPTFTNFADINIHAVLNAQEIWPPVGVEPVVHTRFIPLMLNIGEGTRFQILSDDTGINTPVQEITAVVRMGQLIGRDNIYVEGYFGTGVLANILNRTFPHAAKIRWHSAICGDLTMRVGGFEYSGPATGNALVVAGATRADVDGIPLGWPMHSGNAFVVSSVTNQAYEGLFIYDLPG